MSTEGKQGARSDHAVSEGGGCTRPNTVVGGMAWDLPGPDPPVPSEDRNQRAWMVRHGRGSIRNRWNHPGETGNPPLRCRSVRIRIPKASRGPQRGRERPRPRPSERRNSHRRSPRDPDLLQGREISTRRKELRRTRRVAMVLVLCIGDFHVPYRSSGMPKKFLVRRRWTRREGRRDRWRPGANRRETDAGHARTRKDTNCALHGKPVHKIHATLSQKHCTGRARGAGRLRPGGGISRREGTLRRRKVRRS